MNIHSRQNAGEENGTSTLNSTSSPSRRSFLRKSAIGTAVAVPAIAVAGVAATHMFASSTSAHADSLSKLTKKSAFWEIQSDENAHVSFLLEALGSLARPKPTFMGLAAPSRSTFEEMSKAFENTGVGAYLMAAPAISSKEYLAAAGSILTIEARHAGYLDYLTGTALSPNGAFDKPLTQAAIVSAVAPFIKSLNGGSDPSAPLTSDIDILNFALLLEFLEATFYNLNVSWFF